MVSNCGTHSQSVAALKDDDKEAKRYIQSVIKWCQIWVYMQSVYDNAEINCDKTA